MLPIIKEYEGSVCEVKTLSNDLLLVGRISEMGEDYLQIISNSCDCLPLIRYDQRVKITVFNAKLGYKILTGVAYLSTAEIFRVVDVQHLLDFERRNFFRVNVHMPSSIYIAKEDEAGAAEQPIGVLVENISLNGLLVSGKGLHLQLGDTFEIELPISGYPLRFSCCVKRIPNKGKDIQKYGCSFFNHSERDVDILCKYIFGLQRETIKKRKR